MKPNASPVQTPSSQAGESADNFRPGALRARLIAVVAVALSPLLALSAFQTYLEYREDEIVRRDRLYASAQRAVERVDAAIVGARPLLEALRSQEPIEPGGSECERVLRNALFGMRDYNNLKRIEPDGRVSCSALALVDDVNETREGGAWFDTLRDGEEFAVSEVFYSQISRSRVVLVGVPLFDAGRVFNGALALAINVETLDRYIDLGLLPEDSTVLLVDASGEALSGRQDDADVPVMAPMELLDRAAAEPDGVLLTNTDWRPGRDVLIAPLVEDDLFIVLTTPNPSLVSWASVNLISTVLLPLFMWLIALTAVALASDRLVLHWLEYLGRIARLYGSGRFDIEPTRAANAPDEIAALAQTMQDMASKLKTRERELKKSADQNATLVKEVHHRVKNNLQIIVSLFNIQISKTRDPATITELEEARGRVNALALVHRSLYETEELTTVRLAPFFSELLSHLAAASGGVERQIQIETQVENIELPPEVAVPLALFVTEATTNAFKHAFVAREQGLLRLSVTREGPDIRVDIEDDGVGWSQSTVSGESSGGVGGALMTGFARQLDGQVERSASELGGARLTLRFAAPGA